LAESLVTLVNNEFTAITVPVRTGKLNSDPNLQQTNKNPWVA